jgi:hypothetical protein
MANHQAHLAVEDYELFRLASGEVILSLPGLSFAGDGARVELIREGTSTPFLRNAQGKTLALQDVPPGMLDLPDEHEVLVMETASAEGAQNVGYIAVVKRA